MTAQAEEDDVVIWRADLRQRMQVCEETLRRWIKAGKLPKPDVHLSQKSMGWRMSTLRAAGVRLPDLVALPSLAPVRAAQSALRTPGHDLAWHLERAKAGDADSVQWVLARVSAFLSTPQQPFSDC